MLCTAHGLPSQLYGRTKRDAFREWRQSAQRLVRLKGILARVMSRQLSKAWESWRQLIHDKHQRLEVRYLCLRRYPPLRHPFPAACLLAA